MKGRCANKLRPRQTSADCHLLRGPQDCCGQTLHIDGSPFLGVSRCRGGTQEGVARPGGAIRRDAEERGRRGPGRRRRRDVLRRDPLLPGVWHGLNAQGCSVFDHRFIVQITLQSEASKQLLAVHAQEATLSCSSVSALRALHSCSQ